MCPGDICLGKEIEPLPAVGLGASDKWMMVSIRAKDGKDGHHHPLRLG